MSSVQTWLTNEEVLRGLSEGYVLIGDVPPPIRLEAEDDDMLEQFGEEIRVPKVVQCDNQPDLRGITDLLRMVQGPEDDNDDETATNGVQRSNCVIAISKPMKLNPNVKEFVPKGISSHTSRNVSESNLCIDKTDVREQGTDTDKLCNGDKDLDKPSSYEDLTKKLRDEITEASKSDSFAAKKRNNVAITSLLKLRAKKNNAESPKKAEPKLIAPDFYEKRRSDSPAANKVDSVKVSLTSSEKTFPLGTPIKSGTSSTQKEETPKDVEKHADDEIKKSIAKVNQWLSDPVDQKSPAVFLGPVAFKRKEPTKSKSPSSSETDPKKISNPVQPSQYKPSNYAADLGKEYMKRNKTKESKRNMWADLDVILKEKDEMKRKQLQEASRDEDSDSDQ